MSKPEAAAPPAAPPQPPFRLARFKYNGPPLPSGPPIHSMTAVDLTKPEQLHQALEGWSMSFRGAAAFLTSPRGWSHGKPLRECDGKGKVRVIGPIPLVNLLCEWEGDDSGLIDKLQRFDTPVFSRPAPERDEAKAIDPKEIGDP